MAFKRGRLAQYLEATKEETSTESVDQETVEEQEQAPETTDENTDVSQESADDEQAEEQEDKSAELIAAMEADLVFTEAMADVEEAMVLSVESHMDVEEAAMENDVIEEDSERFERVVDALESLLDHGEASMEDGGWTRQEASQVKAQLNYLTNDVGAESVETPSLEEFGNDGERAVSTKISVEGIKEFAKKAAAALKATIEAAMKALSKVGDTLVTWLGNQQKANLAIKAAAEKAKAAGKTAEGKIDISDQAGMIHVDGKVSDVGATLKLIDNAAMDVMKLTFPKPLVEALSSLEDMVKNPDSVTDDALKAFYAKTQEVVRDVIGTGVVGATLPGGKRLAHNKDELGAGYSARLEDVNKDKVDDKVELDTPSLDVIIANADAIDKIFSELKDLEKELKEIAKAGPTLVKNVSAMASGVEEDTTKKKVNDLQSATMHLVTMSTKPALPLLKHLLSVTNALVKVNSKSLKAYGAKKDAKEESGEPATA